MERLLPTTSMERAIRTLMVIAAVVTTITIIMGSMAAIVVGISKSL